MSDSSMFDNIAKDKLLKLLYDKVEEGTINAKVLVEFLELDRADVANICDINLESVRYDQKMPQQIRIKFIEIANLCELVAENFGGDQIKTRTWFLVKNPLLGDSSPIDLIKNGQIDKLYSSIFKETKY
jgi:hypothetical protein